MHILFYKSPDDTSKIRTYVGEDGNLHFVNKAGADTVLPFSKNNALGYGYIDNNQVIPFYTIGATFGDIYNANKTHTAAGWGKCEWTLSSSFTDRPIYLKIDGTSVGSAAASTKKGIFNFEEGKTHTFNISTGWGVATYSLKFSME